MTDAFTVVTCEKHSNKVRYGREFVTYKLVLDNYETVFMSRAKEYPAPVPGTQLWGTIAPDKDGMMTLTVTARKEPTSGTGSTAKLTGISGSALFDSFLRITTPEVRDLIGQTPFKFVGTFKLFQDLLGRSGMTDSDLELIKAELTEYILDMEDSNNVVE